MTRRNFIHAGAALTAAAHVSKASPGDKIAVGVIGTGARAQELMQSILKRPQDAEIVGVVDAYKGRIERALDRTGGRAKAYPDYHELLAQKSIDAVVVATPDHWHRRIILDAIAAGKDVYSEKPMTYRSSEGVEIVQAARAAGRILQVGSQGVSSDADRKAKDLILSGKLGKVKVVRSAYPAEFPLEMPRSLTVLTERAVILGFDVTKIQGLIDPPTGTVVMVVKE